MFDDLDEVILKDLSGFYFEEKDEICCRVITPYSTAPLEEEILSVSSTYPVNLSEEAEKTVKSSQKRRSRGHRGSGTETSQKSVKELVFNENIIQFPDSPIDSTSDINSSVPIRLKAIKLAEEKLKAEDLSLEFTKLYPKQRNDSAEFLGSSYEEFPLLNSPPNLNSFGAKSSHKYEAKHKMAKLSQKQRKRLSSENSTEVQVVETPKNPWKTIANLESPQSLESSIGDIISSEKKQKENFVKMKSKLLIYTQVCYKFVSLLSVFCHF